jgi:hypothetical protein
MFHGAMVSTDVEEVAKEAEVVVVSVHVVLADVFPKMLLLLLLLLRSSPVCDTAGTLSHMKRISMCMRNSQPLSLDVKEKE